MDDTLHYKLGIWATSPPEQRGQGWQDSDGGEGGWNYLDARCPCRHWY
ncbi:MAG: hypothetical protein R3C53_28490 [Pirellulaceae bacterium]